MGGEICICVCVSGKSVLTAGFSDGLVILPKFPCRLKFANAGYNRWLILTEIRSNISPIQAGFDLAQPPAGFCCAEKGRLKNIFQTVLSLPGPVSRLSASKIKSLQIMPFLYERQNI
ncbi:hypothetical protein [Neisseria chenwenguii]|uniref:hypothetical protein n=1 Tax=Neisseria chenwenguii TaxID=1853278 RepID=UPI000F4E2629|nr:hypothetical protein [Neisseria chenwenguii]